MLEEKTRNCIATVRSEAEKKGIRASFSLHREKSHLMRIGNNSVSLNTSEYLTRLDIRVIKGKREGTHTVLSEITSEDQIREALQIAVRKSELAAEKEYEPIFEIVEGNFEDTSQYDQALAELDPARKADAYAEIFKAVGEDYNYSGSWSSGVTELYFVSTANAHEMYRIGTDMQFSVVLKHQDNRWELLAPATGWKRDDFSVDAICDQLTSLIPTFEKGEPVKLEPGSYTVMFGHTALADLLSMAIWTGFSGRLFEEKQSWTSHHAMGDSIFPDNITIVDDPSNDLTFRYGFDLGGKHRRRFPLVERGIMKNMTYDLSSAAKFSKEPTGHHGIQESFTLETGSGPDDPLEAARKFGRVLYIPALHYMNIPNMSKGIFTGSSRFSATVVENGSIVAPLLSSRITDTFQNVLGNISVISRNAASANLSDTYGRRMPVAASVPTYLIAENVKITDSSDSY